AAQRAIRYLVQSQHSEGGWRYGPRQPGDTSVVAWVFLAIRSGQLARLAVDRAALAKADKFLNTVAAGPDEAKLSRYRYQPDDKAATPALTAAGLLTREYIGWEKDNSDLIAGCTYLMQNLPPEYAKSVGSMYYYYYATQVLHHMEGESWDKWNHRMREHLIYTQEQSGEQAGSWPSTGTDHGSRVGGRLYTSSLALLTLEVYYRHLPLYRRAVKPPAEK
ncbi:MAG: squalene--hopene cyclase, partial [Pirellulales bacterium]